MTGLVFCVAGVFSIFLIYMTFVGHEEGERARSWEIDESDVIEWMAQSIEAQEAFKRDWDAYPEDPEVFANLEKALGFQRKLKAIDPEDAFGSVGRLRNCLNFLRKLRVKRYILK